MVAKPRIILDCDPGHDDAMAILLAARHAELLGITTVSGNAPLNATTRNALLVCQIADIDVEVHAGADRPLLIEAKHAGHVHGESGLDGPELPELTRQVTSTNAIEFIIETVRANSGVWLCPIGPMTNIALALRLAPDLIDQLAGISFMGGSTGHGNVTAAAEFNIWADPHAAEIVLDAGVPVVKMTGLNLTAQFAVDADVSDELIGLGSYTGIFAGQVLAAYIAANGRVRGSDSAHLHDPCAVLAVTHPELFTLIRRHVAVSIGSVTVGMTLVDQRGFGEAQSNVEVLETIDGETAMRLFIETVADYP